jgi:sulfate adenylyltransferase
MPDLIPPHGGLAEPVCCTVSAGEIDSFKKDAAGLAKIPVSDADLSTVYRFGDGALSPLTGPMDRKTYERVLDESVVEHGGKLYAWTIPLAFPVTADLAKQFKSGQKAALTNSRGEVVATLEISDVFEWDKPRYIKSVYLTERTDHPGADMVLKQDADKTHLVGGKIRVLPQPKIQNSASTSSRRARSASC